ncbi:aldo-keto reductase family 1 member B1-like [Glossina fuscipes]|uniref:Aldo-keto reductase family 1 member B1-like n=1 Tax=Glossina fuscipes TaxID=7396 RepID=A0A9C5Z7V9_9MUSC|nr:aldo-keto reductase family 1 member B1-like [Glossina fuscipes]
MVFMANVDNVDNNDDDHDGVGNGNGSMKTQLPTDINMLLHVSTLCSVRNISREIPAITMNNGCKMPIIGLGTWGATDDFVEIENLGLGERKEKGIEPNEMVEITKKAIDCGYRHFDTALMHGNEKQIGDAIQQKIKDDTVTRDELFICTKLWHTYADPDRVILGCERSLKNLGLDYIDLYLIHSPLAAQANDDSLYPTTKDGKPAYADVDYVCTWRAMEDLLKEGLCKSIGISNFNLKQIDRILEYGTIVPQNLQIEHHPYLTQTALLGYCRAHNIAVTAYAPLGSPNRPWAFKDTPKALLNDRKVLAIAKKHDKSPAQILIRYQIEKGLATIPNAGRSETFLCENINVFDFCLRPEDMVALHGLNANRRYFKFTGATGHSHHPFETT